MASTSLLPADTYIVANQTILNDQDRKLLITLYQPIIGTSAISLYFTLWSYLDKLEICSCEWTHHHLMTNMGCRLSEIMEAREKLEAIGLLKTYVKRDSVNHYVYQLYSPLSPAEFFNNPILSTTLYNNVGMKEYDKIVEYFKVPKLNLKEYEDVTHLFSDVFESVTSSPMDHLVSDIKKRNKRNLDFIAKIDLPSILSMIPDEVLNPRSITKDTKDLLYKLSFIYDLSDDEMSDLIRNSISEKHTIDKQLIRKNARKYYQFENDGKLPSFVYKTQPEYLRKPIGDTSNKAKIIYQFETITPYDFLCRKNHGARPSKTDLATLEYLMVDMGLKPGVVNVLVDYVLKINQNKLTKSFMIAIATQWVRSHVETVEDAMAIAQKEQRSKKSYQKKAGAKKVSEKPVWFDETIEKSNLSTEEEQEMKEILMQYK